MRPVLAGASGSGREQAPSAALPSLRGCRGIRAGFAVGGRMSRGRVFAAGLASAGLVLIADHLSKWWVLDIVRLPLRGRVDLLPGLSLSMVCNRGITFGLLHEFGA